MDKKVYSLVAGTVLLIVAVVFFFTPAFIGVDALFPFMFSLIAFLAGIFVLFSGVDKK